MMEENAQKNLDFVNNQIKDLQIQKYFYEQLVFYNLCIKLFYNISSLAEDKVKEITLTMDDKFANDAQDSIQVCFNKRKINISQAFIDNSLNFDLKAWFNIAQLVQFKEGILINSKSKVQNLLKQHSYPVYNSLYLSLKLEQELLEAPENKKLKI